MYCRWATNLNRFCCWKANQLNKSKCESLTLGCLSVHSLNTRRDKLLYMMDMYLPEILALSETWIR